MAEHSVEAYLARQSSDTLLFLLEMWITTNQWHSYEHAVPTILNLLRCRNVQIPQAISAFLEKADYPPA